MNPARRIWDIPPPPGTEDVELDSSSPQSQPPAAHRSPQKDREPAKERPIDRINPYLKHPDYVEYEKRRKYRSRSRSRSRHRRRHSGSRSRRSRSRSRRRRRKYSSSRSRSRSPHRRHKRAKRRKRSSSRRSRSRSRTKSGRKSRKSRTPRSPSPPKESPDEGARFEDEEDEASKDNVFKNDGTFLEMFKKMQEEQQQQQQQKCKIEEDRPVGLEQKKALPAFGKRRGGKVLKTGLVQKVRLPNEEENNSQDVWSVYMKEVRKYKEACCDDDSKTRPLVK